MEKFETMSGNPAYPYSASDSGILNAAGGSLRFDRPQAERSLCDDGSAACDAEARSAELEARLRDVPLPDGLVTRMLRQFDRD